MNAKERIAALEAAQRRIHALEYAVQALACETPANVVRTHLDCGERQRWAWYGALRCDEGAIVCVRKIPGNRRPSVEVYSPDQVRTMRAALADASYPDARRIAAALSSCPPRRTTSAICGARSYGCVLAVWLRSRRAIRRIEGDV